MNSEQSISNSNLNNLICDDEDQLNKGEYLGTFRWKRGLNFPKLEFSYENLNNSHQNLEKWSDFIEKRVTFDLEPHIMDAFSYPLTVMNAFKEVFKTNPNLALFYENTINIIFIGASEKCEERIALESNYFDEIFFFLLHLRSSKLQTLTQNLFNLNFYFVGEEISKNASYTSTIKHIKYNFVKQSLGIFLKDYSLDLPKTNSIIFGLNTGFGAGYLKLTLNWINDLIKLLKLNYLCFFSFTNDYEDMAGELAIFEEILNAKFIFKMKENQFKSMTTYQGESNAWSCGNYGIYSVQGSSSGVKLNALTKLKNEELKEKLIEVLKKNGVNVKI